MSTKTSQAWFGERERAISTPLLALAPTLGGEFDWILKNLLLKKSKNILSFSSGIVGQALSPIVMNNNPNNVWILNIVTACPLLLTIFSSFILLKSAEPPTPPSGSAEKLLSEKPLSLRELGKIMLQILKNRTVLVMITCGGMGGGMLQTLLTQLNQLMCSRNYPIEESSFACIINIAVGT